MLILNIFNLEFKCQNGEIVGSSRKSILFFPEDWQIYATFKLGPPYSVHCFLKKKKKWWLV